MVVKDLHQHLYIATEDIMGTNRVVGTLHYSLVGERALFRVCLYYFLFFIFSWFMQGRLRNFKFSITSLFVF